MAIAAGVEVSVVAEHSLMALARRLPADDVEPSAHAHETTTSTARLSRTNSRGARQSHPPPEAHRLGPLVPAHMARVRAPVARQSVPAPGDFQAESSG
jgi:hypothetical protein